MSPALATDRTEAPKSIELTRRSSLSPFGAKAVEVEVPEGSLQTGCVVRQIEPASDEASDALSRQRRHDEIVAALNARMAELERSKDEADAAARLHAKRADSAERDLARLDGEHAVQSRDLQHVECHHRSAHDDLRRPGCRTELTVTSASINQRAPMMSHAAPDDTQDQINSLHQGIVVELHRRLSDAGAGRGAPFRFREEPAGNNPARDDKSLGRSIEQALRKVTAMQAFIRTHEETIYDLRQVNAARDRQHLENQQLLDDSERRCREEAERAGKAERLVELLEQRNTQLEKEHAELSRKVESLLRAIDPV